MAVHYWTINDKEEMKKLIELGADGLITDRPDLMKEVLEEVGFWKLYHAMVDNLFLENSQTISHLVCFQRRIGFFQWMENP